MAERQPPRTTPLPTYPPGVACLCETDYRPDCPAHGKRAEQREPARFQERSHDLIDGNSRVLATGLTLFEARRRVRSTKLRRYRIAETVPHWYDNPYWEGDSYHEPSVRETRNAENWWRWQWRDDGPGWKLVGAVVATVAFLAALAFFLLLNAEQQRHDPDLREGGWKSPSVPVTWSPSGSGL